MKSCKKCTKPIKTAKRYCEECRALCTKCWANPRRHADSTRCKACHKEYMLEYHARHPKPKKPVRKRPMVSNEDSRTIAEVLEQCGYSVTYLDDSRDARIVTYGSLLFHVEGSRVLGVWHECEWRGD